MTLRFAPVVIGTLFLLGCEATQPPPYQADRKPEDRNQYHGVEGMKQHQKDKSYLMSKELQDKCNNAKIDVVVAQKEKNVEVVKMNQDIIEKTCKS